jgi:hypothetical protein
MGVLPDLISFWRGGLLGANTLVSDGFVLVMNYKNGRIIRWVIH